MAASQSPEDCSPESAAPPARSPVGKLSSRLAAAVTVLVCAGFSANVWFFARLVANPLVELDDWRFLKIYRPFIFGEGPYDWSVLWRDHHPLPVNALLFIGNARWLDLNMSYEVLVGVLFLPVFALLLFRAYLRSTRDLGVRRELVWLAFLFLIPVTFTMSTPRPFMWSLVALGFVANAAILLLFMVFDGSTRADGGVRRQVLLFALTTALFTIFPDRVLLAVPLLLLAGAFALFVQRRAWRMIAGSMLAVVLGLGAKMALYGIFDLGLGGYSVVAVPRLLESVLSHPLDYLRLFEVGIGTGFFNIRALNGLLGLELEGLWPAHFAVLLYLSALVLFFRRSMWRASLVPLLLMAYPLLVLAGIGAYRYDPEIDSYWKGAEPRHIVMLVFAPIGACWVFVLVFLQRAGSRITAGSPRGPWPSLASRVALVSASIVVLTQLFFVQVSWRGYPIHLETWRTMELRIRRYANGRAPSVPSYIAGWNFPEPFDSSLALLRKHRLNLYSQGWRRAVRHKGK
jgi:hypothetical protein